VALTSAQRAQLAARLREGRKADAGPARGPVVQLSQAGDVPLFAVHAVSGTVHEYALLARELDGTCHTWGIEAFGLRVGQPRCSSLGDMADRYAQAVCVAQPTGPVRLVGWSMGGVLAFETACRLSALGRDVPLVVLLDTPYRTPDSYAETEEGLAALFAADAARLLGTAAGSVTATARSVPEQLDRLARHLVSHGGDLGVLRADIDRRYQVFAAHTSALARYEPQSALTADALLVSAHGSIDSAPAWSRMFTGHVRAMTITGDHYQCLRYPDVQQIAAAIRQQL
jgi:thioesterase domain-containing protein